MNVAAWLGEVNELGEYAVHGHVSDGSSLRLEPAGLNGPASLLVDSSGEGDSRLFWTLRPLSDPRRGNSGTASGTHSPAPARTTACTFTWAAGGASNRAAYAPCCLGHDAARCPPGKVNIRLEYRQGEIGLRVNNRLRRRVRLETLDVNTRPVILGNARRKKAAQNATNPCQWRLHSASLNIFEPGYGRAYSWAWTPDQGLPDATARKRILALSDPRRSMGWRHGLQRSNGTARRIVLLRLPHGGRPGCGLCKGGRPPGSKAYVLRHGIFKKMIPQENNRTRTGEIRI